MREDCNTFLQAFFLPGGATAGLTCSEGGLQFILAGICPARRDHCYFVLQCGRTAIQSFRHLSCHEGPLLLCPAVREDCNSLLQAFVLPGGTTATLSFSEGGRAIHSCRPLSCQEGPLLLCPAVREDCNSFLQAFVMLGGTTATLSCNEGRLQFIIAGIFPFRRDHCYFVLQ